MTICAMTIALTTRNQFSRASQSASKQAVSRRTPRGARRRKLIRAFSRNLPRNYRPKRKHLNPFSPRHFGTKISPFWPPFVEPPSRWVVRSCRAFYPPKCPVSRLFLGHRKTGEKRRARAVCLRILFSAQKPCKNGWAERLSWGLSRFLWQEATKMGLSPWSIRFPPSALPPPPSAFRLHAPSAAARAFGFANGAT